MITPYKGDYALGLVVTNQKGRKVISHNGGIEGFNTFLSYFPEDKVTVAVLGNLNGQAPEAIGAALGSIVHGDSVQLASERRSVPVPREVLQRYVGTYEFQPGVRNVVTLEGDQLMTKLGGQPKFPLFPESETRFFLKAVDAQIEFIKNAGGETTSLVIHQSGRDMTCPRISAITDIAFDRQEVSLPPDVLKDYVGSYPFTADFAIEITLEGTLLVEQATGQQKCPLFAEAKDKFFLKVVDAQIEFVRDATGNVTALVLHQGGRDQTAIRKK
jgi:hypothetical protein